MTQSKEKRLKRLLRVTEIVSPNGPLPVGKSTWWEGVKNGRFPKPIKLGPRITVWRAEDIENLLNDGVGEAEIASPATQCSDGDQDV